jgi:hypothetical protein
LRLIQTDLRTLQKRYERLSRGERVEAGSAPCREVCAGSNQEVDAGGEMFDGFDQLVGDNLESLHSRFVELGQPLTLPSSAERCASASARR